MNLYLQFPTNISLLELYARNKEYVIGGNSKTERDVAGFFLKTFPGEVMNEQSIQYETNFLAIRKLKKIDKDIFNKIKGIYYGSDNCEYLMPTKQEIEKALDLFRQIRKRDSLEGGFILNTPYVGEKMLKRAKEGLKWLNEQKTKFPIEVVVNDLGILSFVEKECPNLNIIVGRLIHKLLKTPLVDTYGNTAHVAGELIKNKTPIDKKSMQENLIKWQNKFYQSSESNFGPFKNFLKRHNIKRTTLDFMQNRGDLYKTQNTDLYYPYALIFTGRLCDTSAIETPERGNYAINEVCSRTCFRYDLTYNIKTVNYNLLQKGNAGYRTETDLDFLTQDFYKNENDNRIIFSPFL